MFKNTHTFTSNSNPISADYSFDLTDTIGNRPVIVSRKFENEIPAIFNNNNKTNTYNYNCCSQKYKQSNNCI